MLYHDLGDGQRRLILAADRQVDVCCVNGMIVALVHTTVKEVLIAIHDLCRPTSITPDFQMTGG